MKANLFLHNFLFPFGTLDQQLSSPFPVRFAVAFLSTKDAFDVLQDLSISLSHSPAQPVSGCLNSQPLITAPWLLTGG